MQYEILGHADGNDGATMQSVYDFTKDLATIVLRKDWVSCKATTKSGPPTLSWLIDLHDPLF
jgi:hypothetical protein